MRSDVSRCSLSELTHARDAAVEAARAAARLIRPHAGRVDAAAVREKGVHDLVTHLDEASQALIIEQLSQACPGYTVLAEEGAGDDFSRIADTPRWIIDPIDGTTNFTRGVPPFAVSIALQDGAGPAMGVVLEVGRGELFTAIRGQGLHVDGVPARVSATPTLGESLLTTGFPYRRYDHLDRYLAVLGTFLREVRGVRRPGAASVDLAYVACGRFDGFYESGLMPWDVAAGTVLVREGGGRVTDFSGGDGAVFGRQIVASNGAIHDALLRGLAPMRADRS